MRKSIKWGLAITCLFGLVSKSGAQQTQQEQPEYGWKKEIVATLNLTQASFDNWEQGGESSLAWQTSLDMNFDLQEGKHNWANSVEFELGFAKIAGEEARKSADDIKMESVYTRKLGRLLNPFVAVTAQTQFVAGFEFDDNDNKMKISKFLDPGYFTQSLGLGYSPGENVKTRLGATLKETITSKFAKTFTDDPDTPELEKSRVEGGISSVTDFKQSFEENVLFKSRLDLFSDLDTFDRIDVLWENNLTLKVTKYFNVDLNVDLFYDKDISDRRQLKQVLSVGFTYTFL